MKKLSSGATMKLIGRGPDQRAGPKVPVLRRERDVGFAICEIEVGAKAIDRIDSFEAERRAAENRLFYFLDADTAVGIIEDQRAHGLLERRLA